MASSFDAYVHSSLERGCIIDGRGVRTFRHMFHIREKHCPQESHKTVVGHSPGRRNEVEINNL